MTVSELSHHITKALTPTLGSGEAAAMRRIILEDVMQVTPVMALADPDRQLPDFMPEKIDGILRRILSGEPLQYILGRARFCGMNLRVTPAVLIPRPETEQLVDLIVEKWQGRKDLRILDLGTGSGCIAIALARALPFSQVTAIDISEAALAIARQNATEQKAHIEFVQADILKVEQASQPATLTANWDIIVSNPPYILESEAPAMEQNVIAHEPHLSLFTPDADPMRFYSPIIAYWRTHHTPGGMLYFEINPLTAREFHGAEIIKDLHAKDRFAIYSD